MKKYDNFLSYGCNEIGLPSLQELTNIKKLIETNKLVLSPTGKRVVETPNFTGRWSRFISSLAADKVVDFWRKDLGDSLAFLVGLDSQNSAEDSFLILVDLTVKFTKLYMYNILASCYDPYPVFRATVNKHTFPKLTSNILESLIEYSNTYNIPYNNLKDRIYLPLQSIYVPLGMYRTEDISFKDLLIKLGRLYTINKKKYYEILHKLENGELKELGLTIYEKDISAKDMTIKPYAYRIFL